MLFGVMAMAAFYTAEAGLLDFLSGPLGSTLGSLSVGATITALVELVLALVVQILTALKVNVLTLVTSLLASIPLLG